MSDNCREEFEKHCGECEVYCARHHKYPEQYQLYETQLRWMGFQSAWQASRAAFADEAVERVARAIADASGAVEWNKIPQSAQQYWTDKAKAAIAALNQPKPEPANITYHYHDKECPYMKSPRKGRCTCEENK